MILVGGLRGVALTALAAITAHAQQGGVITLENADSLVGKVLDGQDVRELIGNVRFRQDNVQVWCDRALQYLATGRVVLTGNVLVQDDSLILRAPRGVYHRDERRTEAFEDVQLDDGSVRLRAEYGNYFIDERRAFFRTNVVVEESTATMITDSLTYFRNEERSVATGNVEIHYAADNLIIRGSHFENFQAERFSRMTQRPLLLQFDTTVVGRIDTLLVRSEVMESYRDSPRRLVARGNVELVRSSLSSTAGLMVFHSEGDSILLRETPVVWYQQTQVTGDSINVYLEERRLRLVRVTGRAFAASRSDSLHPTRFDQLTGETMHLFFEDRILDRIEVETRAISLYHLYEDSLGNGLNKTSGDRIVMWFDAGRLSSIRVHGGVEGQYFPENMVRGREHEYAIPGFQWIEHRPAIQPADLVLRLSGHSKAAHFPPNKPINERSSR